MNNFFSPILSVNKNTIVAVLNGFVWEAIKNLLLFWSMHWYFERLFQSFNDFSPNPITMIPYPKKRNKVRVCMLFFHSQWNFISLDILITLLFELWSWARTHDRSAPDCNVIDVVCRNVLIKVCRTDKMAISNGHMANKCRLHTHTGLQHHYWKQVTNCAIFQLQREKKCFHHLFVFLQKVSAEPNTNHDTPKSCSITKSPVNYKALHFNGSLIFPHFSARICSL